MKRPAQEASTTTADAPNASPFPYSDYVSARP